MSYPKCSYCEPYNENPNAGFSTWNGSIVAVCAAHQVPGVHVDANAKISTTVPTSP